MSPMFDLPVEELVTHRTRTPAPTDLREFWMDTLAEARAAAGPVEFDPADNALQLVDTWDVTFSGFGGDPIRAWYHRPAAVSDNLPLVVQYQGYGGGRGLAHQIGLWPLAGYACLEVDTRGQGSGYGPGHTPDPVGSGPAHPGYLTRGIEDRATYYYRRAFTDAVLAVDAASTLPGVDRDRIAVAGGSQGGGLALAVAALRADLAAVLADVPFLADFPRATELATTAPYTELVGYLKVHRDRLDACFATLAYFDVAVLGALASAPALFSVGLMDETCPPSTVYSAFNAYGGPKQISVYPYNDHEGGAEFHEVEQLAFLSKALG